MKRKQIILIGAAVLILQIIFLRDYLTPVHWGQVKVSGLACTCPDETVENGEWYLRSITPDSLKNFELDYSEIYVDKRPYSESDPMGVDLYILKGQVIGKRQVEEGGAWYPLFKISGSKSLSPFTDIVLKIFFSLQLLVFFIYLTITDKERGYVLTKFEP